MRGAIRMEAFPLRPTAHDERLTVTEHLTELRARLLLSVAVLAVLFAGCLWQSRPLLRVLNAPLAQLDTSAAAPGPGMELPAALARSADAFTRVAHASSLTPADRRSVPTAAGAPRTARRLPPPAGGGARVAGAGPARPCRPLPPPRGGAHAGPARAGRAVLDLDHGRPRFRAPAWTAVPPCSGVGVRRAGHRSGRAARGATVAYRCARVLRRWSGLRILRRAPAGGQVPAGLQPRRLRRPGPGAPLLPLRAHDDARPRRDVRDARPAAGPRSCGRPQLRHLAPPPRLCPRRAVDPRGLPARH